MTAGHNWAMDLPFGNLVDTLEVGEDCLCYFDCDTVDGNQDDYFGMVFECRPNFIIDELYLNNEQVGDCDGTVDEFNGKDCWYDNINNSSHHLLFVPIKILPSEEVFISKLEHDYRRLANIVRMAYIATLHKRVTHET